MACHVLSHRWFHGAIGRSTACIRLDQDGRPGAYLIRLSADHGKFALSLLDGNRRVHHFRIRVRNGRFNLGGSLWFSSLEKLVGYHTRYSALMEKHTERLDYPVPPPEVYAWGGRI